MVRGIFKGFFSFPCFLFLSEWHHAKTWKDLTTLKMFYIFIFHAMKEKDSKTLTITFLPLLRHYIYDEILAFKTTQTTEIARKIPSHIWHPAKWKKGWTKFRRLSSDKGTPVETERTFSRHHFFALPLQPFNLPPFISPSPTRHPFRPQRQTSSPTSFPLLSRRLKPFLSKQRVSHSKWIAHTLFLKPGVHPIPLGSDKTRKTSSWTRVRVQNTRASGRNTDAHHFRRCVCVWDFFRAKKKDFPVGNASHIRCFCSSSSCGFYECLSA